MTGAPGRGKISIKTPGGSGGTGAEEVVEARADSVLGGGGGGAGGGKSGAPRSAACRPKDVTVLALTLSEM